MHFYTPRKAAEGLGAAGSAATQSHWFLTVSGIALALLTPAFLLVMAKAISISAQASAGAARAAVQHYFAHPYPAIVTALFLIVGMGHFIRGTRIMIDDYFDHTTRKVAIIVSELFAWAVMAAAFFALAKMALGAAIV